MAIIGYKNNWDLFENLLGNLIPNNIQIYIEPFGGEFGLYELIETKPPLSIYNDINTKLYEKIKVKFKDEISILYYNIDYKKIIKEYDSVDTFFYCDPPYLGNERYYENHTFLKMEDHIELSEILRNIKGRFLLSYQDRKLMRELYDGYNFYKYKGNNYISKPEIAITNY